MLGLGPTTTEGSTQALGSMPWGGRSAWPCRWRTMARKAARGSSARMKVPSGASSAWRAASPGGTTATPARHPCRRRACRSLSTKVTSSGPASFRGRAASTLRRGSPATSPCTSAANCPAVTCTSGSPSLVWRPASGPTGGPPLAGIGAILIGPPGSHNATFLAERPARRGPFRSILLIPLQVRREAPSVGGDRTCQFETGRDGPDMGNEPDACGQWERVASELQACRESQQRAWGDVDNANLGRYLAGEVTGDELRQIEQTLDVLPEVRKLTDLVRDILRDFEPLPTPQPEPRVLPLRPRKRALSWLRRRGPLVAAASLLLALG